MCSMVVDTVNVSPKSPYTFLAARLVARLAAWLPGARWLPPGPQSAARRPLGCAPTVYYGFQLHSWLSNRASPYKTELIYTSTTRGYRTRAGKI